jgi:hypothetical protein
VEQLSRLKRNRESGVDAVQLFAALAERLSRLWSGPAPKPSADTVKALTRSLDGGVSLLSPHEIPES